MHSVKIGVRKDSKLWLSEAGVFLQIFQTFIFENILIPTPTIYKTDNFVVHCKPVKNWYIWDVHPPQCKNDVQPLHFIKESLTPTKTGQKSDFLVIYTFRGIFVNFSVTLLWLILLLLFCHCYCCSGNIRCWSEAACDKR